MKNTFTIGFSPCPNDTFIFDALVNGKIDIGNFSFTVVLEDVQTLNEWALEGRLDISKISYGVLPKVSELYALLNSGSALGNGVGPLLIHSNQNEINYEKEVVAIPGEHTTAHRLFVAAYPDAKNKIFLRYNEIENYVQEGKGPGVIIHENRFTYASKGLYKVADLGELWENKYNVPIPLGGIIIKKNIDVDIQKKIDFLIKKSLEYSYSKYPELSTFVKQNAQEMNEEVMRKHIDLYVNDFSLSLGEKGKAAVNHFISVIPSEENPAISFV